MLLELRTPSQDILQAVHDGRYAGLVACTLNDLDSLFLQPPRHAGSPNSLVPEVAYFGVQEQQLQMWCSLQPDIANFAVQQEQLQLRCLLQRQLFTEVSALKIPCRATYWRYRRMCSWIEDKFRAEACLYGTFLHLLVPFAPPQVITVGTR